MGMLLGWLILETGVLTAASYLAAKISLVKIEIIPLLVIALLVSLMSLVPQVGWVCGTILFVILLQRATKDGVVDCLWVAFLSKPISWMVLLGLSAIFA